MDIVVFTGPGCAYCATAKKMLEDAGHLYVEKSISEGRVMEEFHRRLPRLKALPQIFINGEHIGNHEDLRVFLTGQKR